MVRSRLIGLAENRIASSRGATPNGFRDVSCAAAVHGATLDESIRWEQTLASRGRVDFRVSRRRVVLMLIGALFVAGFLGLFAIAMGQTRVPDPVPKNVFAVICAVFALLVGAAAVSLFLRLIRGGIALSVTTEGVWVRGPRHPAVPWSSITSITVATYRRNWFVQLNLTDQEYERQAKFQWADRLLSGLNRRILDESGLWLPNIISAEPTELAAWLDYEWSGRRADRTLGS